MGGEGFARCATVGEYLNDQGSKVMKSVKLWFKQYMERSREIEAALRAQCLERDRQSREYLMWKNICGA